MGCCYTDDKCARATECSREPSNLTTGTNYSSDRELTTVAAPATTQSASCAEADGHDNGEQLRLQRQLRRPRQELARHGGHGLPAHNERRFDPLHAGSELREYHRRADEAAEINGGCSNIYATRSKRCTLETEFECAQLLNTDRELWGAIVAPGEYAECEAARPSTTTTTEAMDCCFARAAKWLCNEGVIEDDAQDECVIEEVQSLKLFDDVSFFHFRSCFGALSSKSCDGIERVEGAVFVDIDAGEQRRQ